MHLLRVLAGLSLVVLAAGCIIYDDGTDDGDTSDLTGGEDDPTGEPQPPKPLVVCDPLAQDCEDGLACTLIGGGFDCVEVLVSGGEGDACVEPQECGAGLACVPGSLVPGCATGQCCVPLCEVGDPGATCPGADQGVTCGPALSGADLPAEWLTYGACVLP